MKTPEELRLWDEIVDASGSGTVYHLARFQDIVVQAFPLKKHLMGIYREKDLVGVIPLFFQKESLPEYVWSPYDRIR